MATTTKVRIKKAELANATISTAYGRFKFDGNGIARVPIELARELVTPGSGFVVIDEDGNVIDLPNEDETIPGGDDTVQPEPTVSPEPVTYSLNGGGTYTTIEGGYVLNGDGSQYTLIGSSIDSDNIYIKNGNIGFEPEVDTSILHIMGVDADSTIKIGDTDYKWINADDNLDNGLELVSISSGEDTVTPDPTIPGGDDTVQPDPTVPGGDETIQPEPVTLSGGGTYYNVDGGFVLNDGNSQYTLMGDTLDTEHIAVKDGNIVFSEGINPAAIHVMGVVENDTISIGKAVYKYENTDNISSNGLELVLVDSGEDTVQPEPTIPGGDETIPGGDEPTVQPEPVFQDLVNGGKYATIEGGYLVAGETAQYTLMGDTLDTEHVSVKDDNLVFSEGINPAAVHVMGVEKDSTIEVGTKVYKYGNTDNMSSNGLELILVSDSATVQPEPTIPGGDETIPGGDETIPGGDDTVQPEPGDSVNGFQYDFDGKSFTVSGGLKDDLTENDLNENAVFDGESLTLGGGTVSDVNDVHVQGLDENSTIDVEGEKFVLKDADNNPDNGLELVGPTSDVYGWKFANRSVANYESQIWKHTTDGVEDIVVVGCTARPSINNNTLTILGENIKVITNAARDPITIDSQSITGELAKGVTWDSETGIKTGLGTKSYVLSNNTLYIPKAYVTHVTGPINWELNKGTLNIIEGEIEISKTIAKGSTISSIKYKNKTYYVNVKTGKLVPNAWQKKK